MDDFVFDDLHNLRREQEAAENAAKSVGYSDYRVGKIIQKAADCNKAEVILCVLSVVKTTKGKRKSDTEYTAKHVDIHMSCATATEAVLAFAGLHRGYYVAYDDNAELLAVLSGSFDD